MDWKSATPGTPNFFDNSLKNLFFELKTPGFFWEFLGDHFARVESSEDQDLTMSIVHVHVFSIFDPPKKVMMTPARGPKQSFWKLLVNFRNGLDIFFNISLFVKLFDMKVMQNLEKKLRSLNSFFRGFLAPLKIMQKSFSDGQGGTFFEKCKLFFSCNFGTS